MTDPKHTPATVQRSTYGNSEGQMMQHIRSSGYERNNPTDEQRRRDRGSSSRMYRVSDNKVLDFNFAFRWPRRVWARFYEFGGLGRKYRVLVDPIRGDHALLKSAMKPKSEGTKHSSAGK